MGSPVSNRPRCSVKREEFTTRRKPDTPQRQSGFTLVELMITLAVMAIIASVAIPGFQAIITTNRLASQANDLVAALNYARSEAVKRRQTVTVTSNDGNNWSSGWIITDAGGTTLRVYDALGGNLALTATDNTVQYLASGFTANAAAVTFDLCINSGEPGRQIEVSPTGRPHTDTEYVCP